MVSRIMASMPKITNLVTVYLQKRWKMQAKMKVEKVAIQIATVTRILFLQKGQAGLVHSSAPHRSSL